MDVHYLCTFVIILYIRKSRNTYNKVVKQERLPKPASVQSKVGF